MNNEYQEPQDVGNIGTAPEPSEPAAAPPLSTPVPTAAVQKNTRRIGTLTMGFALIVTGVTALVATFYPAFDLTIVWKLSPMIFVFLGIEILVSYFFSKGAKLKYDFLSGFVCFMLICGGLGLAAIPTVWKYAGPPAAETRRQLYHEVENTLFEALKDETAIDSLQLHTDMDFLQEFGEINIEKLAENIDIYVDVSLAGAYKSNNAFARDCARILNRMKDLPYSFAQIRFENESKRGQYNLTANNRFQFNLDATRLEEQVTFEAYDYEEASQTDEAA